MPNNCGLMLEIRCLMGASSTKNRIAMPPIYGMQVSESRITVNFNQKEEESIGIIDNTMESSKSMTKPAASPENRARIFAIVSLSRHPAS